MLKANETLYSRAFMLPAQWGPDGCRRRTQSDLGSFNPLAFTLAVNNAKRSRGGKWRGSYGIDVSCAVYPITEQQAHKAAEPKM